MKRTGFLNRSSPLKRKTAMKRINHERLARLEASQFGEYGEHIASLACLVTGARPVDRAHVLRDRSVGGGPNGLAPLARVVHIDFDDGLLSDVAFERRWRVSRADIRAWAKASWETWCLADRLGA
jgi:hypothetical protein